MMRLVVVLSLLLLLLVCIMAATDVPHDNVARAVNDFGSLRGHHHKEEELQPLCASVDWAVAFSSPHDEQWFQHTFARDMCEHLDLEKAFEFVQMAHKSNVAIFRSAEDIPHRAVATLLAAEQRRTDDERHGVTWFERQHQRKRGTRS